MPVDLLEAYRDVLERINKLDYEGLATVMDPDIILKRVLKPGSVIGIGNVKVYLIHHMLPRKPSFRNLTDVTFYLANKADQASAIHAQVSGIGEYYQWQSKPSTRVRFIWTFTRTDSREEWFLLNAFAAPLS
jgi:hypothetical protein